MSTTKYPQAAIRITGDLVKEIQPMIDRAGGSVGGGTREFLEWSVKCLQAGRTELQRRFTVQEWHALAATFQGTFLEPSIWAALEMEWQDADDEIRKAVDAASVEARLTELTPAGRWAFCDALNRLGVLVSTEHLRTSGVRPRL